MKLAGVDLAWKGENNASAIAIGHLRDNLLTATELVPAVHGMRNVESALIEHNDMRGIAIDAPLIMANQFGQRACEKSIGRVYGSRKASCHTSNLSLYPDADSVSFSNALSDKGFEHLVGNKWQIECYPHPAIIEIFGLPERLLYKKGEVATKRSGQKQLAELMSQLTKSPVLGLQLSTNIRHFLEPGHIDSLSGSALKSNEDALDALVCLYIAGLHGIGSSEEVHGNVRDGYIVVPTSKCTRTSSASA